jgi:hypothetical protein
MLTYDDPDIIERWWHDRSWNQFFFSLVVCTAQPVSPDDEVRAEMSLDGKPLSAFLAVDPNGRQNERAHDGVEAHGAPPFFFEPRRELRIQGRMQLLPLRAQLQNGSEHRITVRVRSKNRVLAEGQVPLRLIDQNQSSKKSR